MSDSLKDVLLKSISPNARTLAEVRQELRRNVRRTRGVETVPMHDDRDDVEGMLRLLTPELTKRGITFAPQPGVLVARKPDLTLFPTKHQVRLHFVVTTDIPLGH